MVRDDILARIVLTIAVLALSILLFGFAIAGTIIALSGCGICEDQAPNYITPFVLFGGYALFQWFLVRLMRAAWTKNTPRR